MSKLKVDVKTRLLSGCRDSIVGTCMFWTKSTSKYGYGQIRVEGKTEQVHRVSYREFVGEIPEGVHVLHRCDVRNCINPDHLFLGTHQDNMDDMNRKGRGDYSGLINRDTKLNINKVKIIRAMCKYTNKTQSEIGDIFDVKSGYISKINRREIWKSI